MQTTSAGPPERCRAQTKGATQKLSSRHFSDAHAHFLGLQSRGTSRSDPTQWPG